MKPWLSAALIGLSLTASTLAAPLRPRTYIDTPWEKARVEATADPLGGHQWTAARVPDGDSVQTFTDFGRSKLLYRTRFAHPAPDPHEQVYLVFEAARFRTTVYLDGHKLGTELDGWSPFEFEITDLLHSDAEHRLIVEVEDWTSTSCEPLVLDGLGSEMAAWGRMRHKLLAPVGCSLKITGLMGRVWIEARPRVRLARPTIRTSWRNRELTILCPVENHSSAPVSIGLAAEIEDPHAPRFNPLSLQLPSGQQATLRLQVSWPDPRPWSPDDPHLYNLHLRLTGEARDRFAIRFGFREIWTEGDRFILNGVPILPCMASTGMDGGQQWGRWVLDPNDVRLLFERTLATGATLFRPHAAPWPDYAYDLADEMGLMIVPESALWTWNAAAGAYLDPRYWQNIQRHWTRIVALARNHPSVVMYSIENEMIRTEDTPSLQKAKRDGLIQLGRFVKHLDPTRLIQYSYGADAYGVADVINLHYPREPGEGHCWPNDWYWLNGPVQFTAHRIDELSPWTWDRGKPLIIGEYGACICPSADMAAAWFGNRAYQSPPDHHWRFKRLFWSRSALAYRWFGAIPCPWHMYMHGFREDNAIFRDCAEAFAPIRAVAHPQCSRVFAAGMFSRRVMVFNDTMRQTDLTLRCSLGQETSIEQLSLAPAERCELAVDLPVAGSTVLSDEPFTIAIEQDGQVVFREEQPIRILPRQTFEPVGGWAAVDPDGRARNICLAFGIPVLENPAQLPPANLLVASIPNDPDFARQLDEFARIGGTVLITAADPTSLLPWQVDLDETHDATRVFPIGLPQTWQTDLREEDFCFWADDHLVSRGNLVIPQRGGSIASLQTAGYSRQFPNLSGLSWTPLLRIPHGRGQFIVCRLLLAEKLAAEPAVGLFLRNVLADPRADLPEPKGLITDAASQAALDRLGVACDEDFDDVLHLVCSSAADPGQLRQWVDSGQTVLLHGRGPQLAELASRVLDLPIAWKDGLPNQPVVAIADHPLLMGLSNHCLSWYRAGGWINGDAPPEPQLGRCQFVLPPDGPIAPLLSRSLLAVASLGRGRIILDAVPWDLPGEAHNDAKRRIYITTLLANLGVRIPGPPKAAATQPATQPASWEGLDFEPLTLATIANMGLCDDVEGDGRGGWTDQGENDMRLFLTTLEPIDPLVPGQHQGAPRFALTTRGVPFQIVNPQTNRGTCIVTLRSKNTPQLPDGSDPLPLNRQADRLFFLHATGWAAPDLPIARYIVHYADGEKIEIPLVYGRDIQDWFAAPADLPNAWPAWTGPNPMRDRVSLYAVSWRNPHPERAIESVRMETCDTACPPIWLALTAACDAGT